MDNITDRVCFNKLNATYTFYRSQIYFVRERVKNKNLCADK